VTVQDPESNPEALETAYRRQLIKERLAAEECEAHSQCLSPPVDPRFMFPWHDIGLELKVTTIVT